MNAKARKKEKRRAERNALGTTGTTEHAAQDAELWGEPYVQPLKVTSEPSWKSRWETESPTNTVDENSKFLCDALPHCFVTAVTKRLQDRGQSYANMVEFDMLSNFMENSILPVIEQGIVDMRRLQIEGTPVTRATLQLDWKLYIDGAPEIEAAQEGASTQPKEPAQDEPQRGSEQPQQQPLEGSAGVNADRANDTTAVEKGLWDVAAEKAALEGGSTVKIYQAMKKKLKAKDKKLIVVA